MAKSSSSQGSYQSAPVHAETSGGDTQRSSELPITRRRPQLPLTSPPAFGPFEREGSAITRPTSALQLQDARPFAFYVPTPTATTALTAASSALPITPPSAFPPSRIHSRPNRFPAHGEGEDRFQRLGSPSTVQFAFRPPSEPAPPQSSGPEIEREFLRPNGSGPTAASVPRSSSILKDDATAAFQPQGWPSSLEKTDVTLSILPVTPPEKPSSCFHDGLGISPKVHDEKLADPGTNEEDSPYQEVRASVSNAEDPEMPCLTFRMWFIGVSLTLFGSAATMFFYLRSPSPYWNGSVAALLGFVAGKALEAVLPIRTWSIAGHEFSLNPGPFNVKEHTLIYMFSGLFLEMHPLASGVAFIVVWEKRYHQALSIGFEILFLLSMQVLGIGLAGFCHWLLVWPARAIWPTNLVACATFNALHAGQDEYKIHKGPTQFRVFMTVASLACVWAFVPGYIFTALSYFSFLCWIFPGNTVVNQVFGSISGLGMSIVTLDWVQISAMASPLTIPFWAQLHLLGAFVLVYWVVASILYYSDVWNSGHLPIFGGIAYDRFAKVYNVTRVLDFTTMRLNETAYEEYSPVYLPISFALTYLLAFAIPPAILVQAILAFGPKLYQRLRGLQPAKPEPEDVHAKLMRRYRQVPWWWYGVVFVISIALAFGLTTAQDDLKITMPTVLLAIVVAAIWMIPVCYIFAISGHVAAINLVAQIIPGALWRQNPLVNMVFKAYCVGGLAVGMTFVRGLKLGHYMKIPPKYTFMVQTASIIVTTITEAFVKEWIFAGVQDVCDKDQRAKLSCSHSQVSFAASIVWGLIGPKRQFGKGGVYYGEIYALIAGAVLPLMLWWWCRYRPATWLKKFNISVALTVCTSTPPASGINYTSFFLVGAISQWYFRTRKPFLWARYNYVLASALDAGTAIGISLCFLILQVAKDFQLNWWGNTVWQHTLDAKGVAYYPTDPTTGF